MNAKEKFKKDYSVYRILLKMDDSYTYYSDFIETFEKKYISMFNGTYRNFDVLHFGINQYNKEYKEFTFAF